MAQGTNARRGSAALAETRETPMDRVAGTIHEIDGEPVHIGKLSLNQIIALARVLAEAAARMGTQKRKEMRELLERNSKQKRGEKGDADQEDDAAEANRIQLAAFLVLDLLEEATVGRAFSIILDRPEKWCLAHIGAVDALWIVQAVLEHNDWEEIQSAFLAVSALIRPRKPSS